MQTTFINKLIFVALLLLLAFTPLPYGTVETWSITLWELLIFALTLLWGIEVLRTGRLVISASPLIWPLLGLLLLAVAQLGLRLSYSSYATQQAAIKTLASLLFFLIFATFANTDERRSLAVKVIIAVCALIALIGIGQSYAGKLLWQRATFGPFVNRNHFAGFLEMGIGPAGGLLIGRGVRREWLAVYGSALLLMCAGLVVSASRGGVVALVAELVFLIVIAAPSSSKKGKPGVLLRTVGALLLAAATIVGSIFLVGSEGLVANFTQLEKEAGGVAANPNDNFERYSRRDIWGASWRLIKDHPITGVGLGAFQFAYTRYDLSSGSQRVEQTHNDYLQILADAGLLGGLLTLTFVALLFARGFGVLNTRDQRRRAIVLGALTGCFAIAVHSFVEFNLQVTANAQLFLTLCALATERGEKIGGQQRR